MRLNIYDKDNELELMADIKQRNKQEQQAAGVVTADILRQLNVNSEALPQKCQQILHHTAEMQASLHIETLDPISLSLLQSKQLSDQLREEYEILKLKQKNAELQAKIDRNDKFLKGLRKDLECSRKSLATQNPNPENIQEHIKQLKQKVASYEEGYEKAKTKFAKLSVPEGVMPGSLQALAANLQHARARAQELSARADDVALARDARDAFNSLRR